MINIGLISLFSVHLYQLSQCVGMFRVCEIGRNLRREPITYFFSAGRWSSKQIEAIEFCKAIAISPWDSYHPI